MLRRLWATEVRNAYISGKGGWQEGAEDKAGAEFDAWLDRVRREAKAEALEEAAEQLEIHGRFDEPVWTLLLGRAAAIRQEDNR